jgi:hypothetical protein
MFALAREQFESAAAKLARSDGRLDADQMTLDPHGPVAV